MMQNLSGISLHTGFCECAREQATVKREDGPWAEPPAALACSRRRAYIPATVLFQGKAVERKFLLFSNIQLPTCRHWGARG